MDLNARVDVNCGRKDIPPDGQTETWTPILHLAKAGETKKNMNSIEDGISYVYALSQNRAQPKKTRQKFMLQPIKENNTYISVSRKPLPTCPENQ